MPRDRLDGIKTKAGRVVYDRKPHGFRTSDLVRIEKKFVRDPENFFIPKNCEKVLELGNSLTDSLETLARIAATGLCGSEWYLITSRIAGIESVREKFEFGGGESGGGGASRSL